MLRHLALFSVVFICGSIIHALPVDEPPQPANTVYVQESADNTDDLETAASWGGYGIRGWFGPSYYGGNWGGRGYYGNGWGNRGHHHGGSWTGWGNQGYGGWGRNHGYGSGWNGYRGGYGW